MLAVIAVIGVAAVAWGFTAGPRALLTAALWPNMAGLCILMQFRPMTVRVEHQEQWPRPPVPLNVELAKEAITRHKGMQS
jgi:hypothetical protein